MPGNDTGPNGGEDQQFQPTLDIEARHAQILGKPPHILPLKPEAFGKEALEVSELLRDAVSLPSSDVVPEFVATMLRHPVLCLRHTELALQLFSGALSARHRELAVLRLAWLSGAPYEWGEHVVLGKRLAKLTSEETERVTFGSEASGWNEEDRAILRAVEELLEDAKISDETWAILARHLNDQQLIELPILVGQYLGVAYLQNSLRCRLWSSNPGLSAR